MTLLNFDDLEKRLADGRALSPFDEEVINTVAALIRRLRDARRRIDEEGTIIDDGKGFPVEHPALLVERRASAELRGWVKDRPDLFGERRRVGESSKGGPGGGGPSPREKFGGFKAVK